MDFTRNAAAAFVVSSLALGCVVTISDGDDTEGGTGTATDDPTANESDDASSSPGTSPESDSDASDDTSQADSTGAESDGDSTSGGSANDCDFTEDFEGLNNGDAWPSPWTIDGGVAAADIQDGRGRLQAEISGYSLARISVPLDCTNVDASVTFMFTDGGTQGAAFYARTNGGYLQDTNPAGEGYAAFAELFRDPAALGVWREVGGQEQQVGSERFDLQPNVDYRMRFRLTQQDPSTSLLQAKIWPLGDDEPAQWLVERTDDTASLQGVGGGIALDAWSSEAIAGGGGADLFFDDVVVTQAQ